MCPSLLPGASGHCAQAELLGQGCADGAQLLELTCGKHMCKEVASCSVCTWRGPTGRGEKGKHTRVLSARFTSLHTQSGVGQSGLPTHLSRSALSPACEGEKWLVFLCPPPWDGPGLELCLRRDWSAMQCLNIPGEVGYGLFCFPECDCDTIPVPRCHLVWRPCLSPPLLVSFSFPFRSSLSLLLETLPNLIQS